MNQAEMQGGRQMLRAGEGWGECRQVPARCLDMAHADRRQQEGGSKLSEPPLLGEAYLQALGHCVVDHKAHVRLVNPHACKQGKQRLSSQGTGRKHRGAAQSYPDCRGAALPPASPARLLRPYCRSPALLAELVLEHLERMPEAHVTCSA